MTADELPERTGQGTAWDLSGALLCIVVGLLLAAAPHLATLARFGTLDFAADQDDLYYLAMSRAPYHGESRLRDPYCRPSEGVPTHYSWTLIGPLAKLTHALGLPLRRAGLVWRLTGGGLLGGALFVLFRRLFTATRAPAAWAVGATLICLADAGFGDGRSFVGSLRLLPYFARGTTPLLKPDALPHFRVVPPLLVLPGALLIVAGLVPRATKRWAVLGGLGLGLCVLMYFYNWTAAVLALGLYLGWLLLLAWRGGGARTDALGEAVAVVLVLAVGLAIGLPQVIDNGRTFANPEARAILGRMFKPTALAAGDPMRSQYVRNVWVWGKLALGAWGIVGLGLTNLRLLWCFTLAGYALANSALVTGLEFENAHWAYVYSPAGEVLILGVGCQWLDRRARARLRALWLVPAVWLAIALVWRPYEALRAPDARENQRLLAEFAPLRPDLARLGADVSLAGPEGARVAVLDSRCGLLYASPYTWTALISDDELHQRHALNGWLQGLDEPTYAEGAGRDKYLDEVPRPQYRTEAVRDVRVALFRKLAEPSFAEVLLARYRPDSLLLPAGAPAPRRAGPWRLLRKSPRWALWERRPAEESGKLRESRPRPSIEEGTPP